MCIIIAKKRLPAPTPQERVGADREGAHGQSEDERGWQESRRRDGGWNSLVSHRKVRKDRKGVYCPCFASFAVQYFINNIF